MLIVREYLRGAKKSVSQQRRLSEEEKEKEERAGERGRIENTLINKGPTLKVVQRRTRGELLCEA